MRTTKISSRSQCQLVLSNLIDHGYITQLIATNYGVRRLASRHPKSTLQLDVLLRATQPPVVSAIDRLCAPCCALDSALPPEFRDGDELDGRKQFSDSKRRVSRIGIRSSLRKHRYQ